MDRRSFIFLVGAVPLLGAATPAAAPTPAAPVEIPVEVGGGRFFAVPRALDGRTFTCWLDTDGSGFIFDSAIETFGLPFHRDAGKRRAVLPPFRKPYTIPPIVLEGGELPVFERTDADKRDPILQGFDAQLGRTWFAERIWRLNYPARTMQMLSTPLDIKDTTIELTIDNNYPRVLAVVGDEALTMAFDTAASIAYSPTWREGGPEVQATSFVPRATLERWHLLHPSWKVSRDVGSSPGFDRIVVPQVRVGAVELGPVAFTTRPGDDVFAGDQVAGKLGANAYADAIVTIDYPNRRLRLDRQAKSAFRSQER